MSAGGVGPDQLRELLARHDVSSSREERSRRLTLSYLDWLSRPFDEVADPTHVTASAVVVAADGSGRIALHRHKRLRRWLQPGGHVDPGETVEVAALREVTEETGLAGAHPDAGPELVHIDVHQGPRGHVHLDTRWLVLADPGTPFAPAAGESPDVAWFGWQEAAALGDPGLAEAIHRAVGHTFD